MMISEDEVVEYLVQNCESESVDVMECWKSWPYPPHAFFVALYFNCFVYGVLILWFSHMINLKKPISVENALYFVWSLQSVLLLNCLFHNISYL